MRALCGAIITAGALVGMGLTALGIGTRYSYEKAQLHHISEMDRGLILILVLLIIATLIGLGIAFLGLAAHHERRNREFQWHKERAAAQRRTSV